MRSLVINDVEMLYRHCQGKEVFIYGAKTVAQRAEYYLGSRGVQIAAFVVSNQYENPEKLHGKSVLRIEETPPYSYECMILAVSGEFLLEAKEYLKQYAIEEMLILSPLMDDSFPKSWVLSETSRISTEAYLHDTVQIVVDDSSSLTIEDGVIIGAGTKIFVENHSSVIIRERTTVGECVEFKAFRSGNIEIGKKSGIGRETILESYGSSKLKIDKESGIGRRSIVTAGDAACINIESKVSVGGNALIGCVKYSNLTIGMESTLNSHLLMIAENTATIHIGKDNMFSFFTKIVSGAHKIIDRDTGADITNYQNIRTRDHVWVGMGAMLLPGCDVGEGSIVGAGAIVTKEIPPNVTCAGNPAKVLRENIAWER